MAWSRRLRATRAINRRLHDWHVPKSAATIGVYAAVGAEVILGDVINHWLDLGHRVAWPRIEGEGKLSFHLATPDELVLGAMGIAEPSHDAPIRPVETLDLLLVPGVGFDRSGARLGQGGGYYDRLLARTSGDIDTVGIAFSSQIVPNIPTEATDCRVDAVVTERGVARGGSWSL